MLKEIPYPYCYEIRSVSVRRKQSNKLLTEKRRCILEYSGKHKVQVTVKTALAQTSSTSRQQITINNSNSTQRLTADQLAKRTSLQRDSSNSADVQRRLSHLSSFIYLF
ncbi:hypothetical protein AVEN_137151-1 [Araneus ventricosus]|uniref:Uncharacterized protein n=1 Tax=Araneus ventricosus TaxID=182803 RepID=A0A4Y2Q4W4_ARAVE|nr:hypothetical protein AVEN_137151-1 [Araneus ventricosus]